VWADRSADLSAFGMRFPTTWLVTLDSIISVSTLTGSVIFWQSWAKRHPEPDELTKLILGCAVSASGALCLAAGAATGAKVNFGWLLAFHLLNDIGFANIFPVSLALYARAAPAALGSTIIGIYYLHLFAGNVMVGWLGGLLDKIPATEFWLIHAALTGLAGLVFLLVRPVFRHILKHAHHG
jgi:POT family proton-dependent oligopeptide transporter